MSDTVKIVDNDQLNEEDLYPDYNDENIGGGPNVNESYDDNSYESDSYYEEYGRYPTPDPADFSRPIRVSNLRWYILAVFSLLGVWQGMIWNSMGPISDALLAVFCPEWSKATLAMFGNWGNIMYIIPLFPVLWILETKGLRNAMIFTSSIMFVGVALRCFPMSTNAFTWICHINAILNGVAGIVVFSAPSALSAAWFPPRERTTATGIALVFNNLGNAASFLMAPHIVEDPHNTTHGPGENFTCPILPLDEIRRIKNEIAILMYVEGILVLATFIAILIYFPAKPKSPPSVSSMVQRVAFFPAVKSILTNKRAILLCLAYSLFNGVIASWFSVMNITFEPLPFDDPSQTDKIIGRIGILSIVGNCVTSITVARIVDKLKGKMKIILSIIMVSATACWIWMCLICLGIIPFSLPQLYVSTILASSLTYSASPIFFEFCVEIVYPIPEGIVGGFLTLVYNTFGMIFLFLFYVPQIANNPDWIPYAIMSSTTLSLPLMLFVREEYNRAFLDRTLSPIPEDTETLPADDDSYGERRDRVSNADDNIRDFRDNLAQNTQNTQNTQNNSV